MKHLILDIGLRRVFDPEAQTRRELSRTIADFRLKQTPEVRSMKEMILDFRLVI